jgi:hypothetical protein
MKHQFFSNASFGRSVTMVSSDHMNVYHIVNTQFRFTHNPYSDLRAHSITNEELASQFGEFMKTEFLKALESDAAKIKKEWDEGEKVVTHDEHGTTTSFLHEKQPVYSPVKGEFAPIG